MYRYLRKGKKKKGIAVLKCKQIVNAIVYYLCNFPAQKLHPQTKSKSDIVPCAVDKQEEGNFTACGSKTKQNKTKTKK